MFDEDYIQKKGYKDADIQASYEADNDPNQLAPGYWTKNGTFVFEPDIEKRKKLPRWITPEPMTREARRANGYIRRNKVVVFSLSNCEFSWSACYHLKKAGVKFREVQMDKVRNSTALIKGVKDLCKRP